MKKSKYLSELSLKKLSVAMAFSAVCCLSAYAQSPSDSPPPLPPLPLPGNVTSAPSGDANAPTAVSNGLPDLPMVTQMAPPPGESADKSTVATPPTTTTDTKNPASTPLADLPPLPEPTQVTAATTAPVTPAVSAIPSLPQTAAATNAPSSSSMPPLPGLPDIPVPNGSAVATNAPPPLMLIPPSGDANLAANPTALPEVKVKPDKPEPKTWEAKLEPTIVPLKIHFNYKRDVLPSSIYRTGYDEMNTHLPILQTRQDYQNLLFQSISNNDVVATRALLNAGTDVNTRDGNGDTALTIARRAHAPGVAELLIARGGHS